MYQRSQIDLLRELAIAQYKLKDQSTVFGFLWSFLHPLALLLVLFVFFNGGFGGQIEHYPIYMLLGLVHYTHFANTTGAALRTLRDMRELTAEAVFPKELLVFANVVSGSIEFVISMAICLGLAAAAGVPPSAAWLWVLPAMALQLLLAAWVGLGLASLYPFAGDIDHIYQIVLRMLFFGTPIFYDSKFLGNSPLAQTALEINPLAQMIGISRDAVLHGELRPGVLAVFTAVNLAGGVVALWLFKKLEPRFAENV